MVSIQADNYKLKMEILLKWKAIQRRNAPIYFQISNSSKFKHLFTNKTPEMDLK